ncbi:collagen-binding domain-containing protein [Muricoccus vinaceus]|uniref:Collagen-binding domain-containing protein n=1 Tax=Muricoccus vinaceus TaxID=424704 RepID=A0ABV6IUY4_9PROT
MKLRLIAGLALAAGLLAVIPAATAAPITAAEILSKFNAVVLGDFSSNSDVEGRLLVGGNLTGGATFNNNPRGAGGLPELGALNVHNNVAAPGPFNVNNGGGVVVGGTNNGTFNLNGGGTLQTGLRNFDPAQVGATLGALSGQLTALQANSQVDAADPNNAAFNAAPDSSGRAVFTLSTTALESYRNINFNLNGASTVIVNVSGTSFQDMANFNAAIDVNQRVLWNFFEADTLSFGFWHGAVLAIGAQVTNSTPIEGVLMAGSFSGRGELHDHRFLGSIPDLGPTPVPEPASLALFGGSILFLGVLARRQRGPARGSMARL